jgi:hypothetical protein
LLLKIKVKRSQPSAAPTGEIGGQSEPRFFADG